MYNIQIVTYYNILLGKFMNFPHPDATYYYLFLKAYLSLDITGFNELECFFITKSQFWKGKCVTYD